MRQVEKRVGIPAILGKNLLEWAKSGCLNPKKGVAENK